MKNPNPGIYSTAGNKHPGHSPFHLQHTTLNVYSALNFLMIMLFLSLSPAGIAFASHSYGLKPSLQKQISSPIQNKQTEHLSSLLVSSCNNTCQTRGSKIYVKRSWSQVLKKILK